MSAVGTSLLDPSTSILIVDDNTQYSTVLRLMLQRTMGYSQIVTVDSTQAGLALLQSEPERFRLVFIDYHFPDGTTGGALLEQLRAQGLLDAMTAFLITSEPSVHNLKQALAAGARGVVAKPFDSDELRRQLEKAERARQVLQED